jgi:hypothetical protein
MYKSSDKDILKNDDFVEEGAIEDHILVEIDKFIAVMPVLESVVKKSAANISNDLKNINLGGMKVADMQKLNKTLDDADKVMQNKLKTEKMHTQVLREQEKLEKDKIARQKAQLDLDKQQVKQNKDLEDNYKKLNQLRKDQVKIYQDLASKQAMGIRLTEEEGKQMEKSKVAAQAFDEKLKNIDYTIGNAQRNVGNYHNQLNTLGKSLKGFSALGDILARALGIDTELFTSIKEGGKALQDIKHVIEGVTLAKEGETVAHEANTAAVEVETVAINASTLGIGLLVSGIIAAGAAIVTYIGHLKDQREEEDKIKQVEEQRMFIAIETLKMKAKNARDTLELYYKWEVLQGKMTEQEKESALAAYDTSQERGAAFVKEQKLLTETAKAYKVFLDAQGNVIKNRDEITKLFTKREYDPETKKFIPYVDNNAVEKYFDNIPKYEKEAAGIHDDYKRRMDEIDKESAITQGNITADHAAKEQKTDKETTKVHKEEEEKRTYVTKIEKQKREEPEKGIKTSSSNQSEADKKHYAYLDWLADNDRFNEALQKVKEHEDAITDAMREGIEKRAQMQQEYDQQGIDYHKRMYDTQAKLAAEGKENTLAYEQAALTKAEEKKIQDQKRAMKAQEGIALFKVFNDTLIKSLERDPNSTFGERLSKALGETAVVKSIYSLLFAGSFEKGTESLDVKSNIDGRGGIPIIAHPKERIMTAGQNELLEGMSNDEVAYKASMFDSLYSQLYNSANASSTQAANASYNHDYRMTTTLSREIRDMKQDITRAIEEKPVQFVHVGQVGQLIEEVVQGGMTRITNHYLKTRRPRV